MSWQQRDGAREDDAVLHAVARALADTGPGLYGVACSGGADSIALADAAIRAAGATNVVVITIDHGLGPESASIASSVGAWAREQGAAAVVRRVTVEQRASLEAAARAARYAALDAIADELGLACILVAHTARDQAETVLLRILRGTGPAGLAAIAARRGRIVRPLLAIERATVDAYVARRGLPTWDDPMNRDRQHARVRVRHELLPLLARENPQLSAALVRLASSAREWLEVIDERAAPLGRFPIDCAVLAREPAAIRKRALAIALEAHGIEHAATHLDDLDQLVVDRARGERSLDLPGARLVRSYDELAPASTHAIDPRPTLPALPDGYRVRGWQPGDRMRPARLAGRSRKLADLFIDAKVPRSSRAAARVIERMSDGAIVWADYLGLAHDTPVSIATLAPLAAIGARLAK